MKDKQPDRLQRAGARMRKLDAAPHREGEEKEKRVREQLPAEEKRRERKPLHGILNSLDDVVWAFYPGENRPHYVMKQHSEKGYRIARSSPDLVGVADLILRHHERWDGSGYPLGLKGEEIPLVCRILAIVDGYDAMVNDRPYSAAMSEEEAAAELARHAGTQFDPHLVPVFLKILAEMRRSSPQKKV